MTSNKESLFNNAAIPGLILGGISIVALLINWLLSKSASGFAPALSFIVGIAKIILCIWVFRAMLYRYYKINPETDSRSIFKLGCLIALLSALVYSGFYFAYTLYIEPDLFKQAVDEMRDVAGMDASAIQMLDEMLPQMPSYSFIANIIYCFLYGMILSAIFSRRIAPRNPFKEQ